jgi:hypothetical protein
VGHSVSMEIVEDAAAFLHARLPAEHAALPPPAPAAMSAKELKEAVREHGLASQAVGCSEKQELVALLEGFYRQQGLGHHTAHSNN